MSPLLIRASSIALSVGVLAYATFLAASLSARVFEGLIASGWSTYLGQPEIIPVRFTVSCLLDAACRGAFWEGWRPSYPVYLPFLSALPLLVGAAALMRLEHPRGRDKPPGGARWATKQDLHFYLKGERGKGALPNPNRGYLGYLPSGEMLRVPERLRVSHTLVIGGTGSGKTTRYAKANLLLDAKDAWSVVVIDMKHPDPKAGFLDLLPVYQEAGHDVQVVLPYGEHSLRFPLLQGAEDETEAHEIAAMVVPPPTSDGPQTFFAEQGRQLMAGLALGQGRYGRTSMGELLTVLSGGFSGLQRYTREHPDARVRALLAPLFDFKNDTLAGIVGGLRGKLQSFADARLEHVTTPSDTPEENVDLEGLGVRPTLLYLGLPEEHLLSGQGQLLLQLMKRALDRALLRTANTHGGQLPVPVSVYLDEFAALGRLPNVERNFATMRSRRVAYHVLLQNRAQGEAVYGKDFASFVTGNFQQTVIFPRFLGFDDVDYFSRLLRNTTVTERTKNTSRKGFFDKQRRGETVREAARPLLSAEEMATWPETMAVALLSGAPPTKVVVPRVDESEVGRVRNVLNREYRDACGSLELEPDTLAADLIRSRMGRGSQTPTLSSPWARRVLPRGQLQSSTPPVERVQPERHTADLFELSAETIPQGEPVEIVSCASQGNPDTPPTSECVSDPSEVILPAAWLRQYGARLEGHPLCDSAQNAIGLYNAGAVQLPAEVITETLGTVPEGLETRKKDRRVSFVIPFAKLTELELLAVWVRANTVRLEGHPDRERAVPPLPDAVGHYTPSTLALLRERANLLDALGGIEPCATQRRRFVGGVRKRVLEIKLAGFGGEDNELGS